LGVEPANLIGMPGGQVGRFTQVAAEVEELAAVAVVGANEASRKPARMML